MNRELTEQESLSRRWSPRGKRVAEFIGIPYENPYQRQSQPAAAADADRAVVK